MPFHQPDEIRYLTFDSFDEAGVTHAVFTRHGGVSPEPWNSLNVGGLVGDDPLRVIENRKRCFESQGRQLDSIYDVWQVHGNDVVLADSPRPLNQAHLKADAILTDKPGVTLFMRFADCVPILLCDPVRSVIGLAHAGWQGTVKKTAAYAIHAMQEHYHSNPVDILAAIGPSIGAHHYEVGEDVAQQVRETFGEDSKDLFESPDEMNRGLHFDLWAANRLILEDAGVHQIEEARLCTVCHCDDWYSHRGDRGKTGRFGIMISL
jgi:hypothetical protein